MVPAPQIDDAGAGLAAVLTNLRDQYSERFDALNKDFTNLLPEFDKVLLDTPENGQRALMLRTRIGSHRIRARDLSQGTLFALVLLTLAHLPDPPLFIVLEYPTGNAPPASSRRSGSNGATGQSRGFRRRPARRLDSHDNSLAVPGRPVSRSPGGRCHRRKRGNLWSTFKRLSDIPH